MRIIRKSELKEGRWRNGMGVSWDIASDPPGTDDFGWRLAIARIDADVPFSHYPSVDRVFTLIEGNGLDLEFEGGRTLAVDRLLRAASLSLRYSHLLPLARRPLPRAEPVHQARALDGRRWTSCQATPRSSILGQCCLVVLDGRAEIDGASLEWATRWSSSDRVSARVEGRALCRETHQRMIGRPLHSRY